MSSLSKNVLSLMVKYRFSYSVCGKSAHTHTHTHSDTLFLPAEGSIGATALLNKDLTSPR